MYPIIVPNPEQERAIRAPHDRPVRIVAGAGTGKTEVISQRFVHLLTAASLRPGQILVLTFSEKAAAEMRARIFRAVAAAGLGYRRTDLADASISTFHAFGARLLRDHSLWCGIDPALPFLTETDAAQLLQQAVTAFLEGGYADAYDFHPLEKDAYTWENGGPARAAAAIIDQLRNQAVTLEAFDAGWRSQPEISDRRAVLAPFAARLYRTYLYTLARRGQLDFDRLIMGAVELLERHTGLRDRVRRACRAILVDEYQDTNYAQERLLRMIADDGMRNVTVVGDPRQAIYVWREARVENIAGFPGGRGERIERPLSQNWRSLKPILDVANAAIAGYAFGEPPEFDAARLLEPACPDAPVASPVVTLHTLPDRETEAQAVAEWITRLKAEGRSYRDIAILIRARTYLPAYTDALEAAGIPFDLASGDVFYTRPEIMAAIHLLRACVDPADTLALAVALMSPAVGLSQADVARLTQTDREQLWDAVTDPEDVDPEIATRLARFVGLWAEAQRQRWLVTPSLFVAWLCRASGLENAAAADDAGAARALQKLLAIAHTYESEHPGDSIEELADHLRMLLDAESREKAPEMTGDADAVQVMTAHASKGLEFPVVIAVDNRQRIAPASSKQPFHEPDAGLVFPEDDENDPRFLTRTRHLRNEARCLWYVTLTRAKERLIITASDSGNLAVDGRYDGAKTLFQELWNREAARPTEGVERMAIRPHEKTVDKG